MPIVGYSRVFGSSFDPLTIGWAHAYWAEGPEFVALGLSNGAAVGTWPDEIGTLDATQGTAASKPTYSATGGPNSRPTLTFDGGDVLRTIGVGAHALPVSLVLIWKWSGSGHTRCVTLSSSNIQFGGGITGDNQFELFAGTGLKTVSARDTNHHLHVGVVNGSSSVLEMDGIATSGNAGSAAPNSGDVFAIGSDNGFTFLTGQIAFFGYAYGDVRTDPKWAAFKAWVTSHYGITVI